MDGSESTNLTSYSTSALDIRTIDNTHPGMVTPQSTTQDVLPSPQTPSVMNACDVEDCFTPLVFSQNSIISQSQEQNPISRFHEELQRISRAILCSERVSPQPRQEYLKMVNTSSRTNAFDSLDSTPSNSRRVSIEGNRTESALPSRLSIIDGIYRKLKKYLEQEIARRSTTEFLSSRTPGKSVLYTLTTCPPLKKINRRVSSPTLDSTEDLKASKRIYFSF